MRLAVQTELDEEANAVGALTATTAAEWSELVVCTSADASAFEALFTSTTVPAARPR